MNRKFKLIVFLTVVFAAAVSFAADAQFVHYESVDQPMPSYSGIAPSRTPSLPSYNYGPAFSSAPTPAPQPQKQVQQVTMYKVENNGNLTKCLGKIEISNSGVILVSVRENGSWWGTRGIVYAISERDPLYQYFNYHVRSASGTQYLF